jgi:hypothetical protein
MNVRYCRPNCGAGVSCRRLAQSDGPKCFGFQKSSVGDSRRQLTPFLERISYGLGQRYEDILMKSPGRYCSRQLVPLGDQHFRPRYV